MEIVRTDILVIGGGGAGMRAALSAKERGAGVLLTSKTPIGKSTCTYLSGGAFSLAVEGISKEAHLKETLQAGKGINAPDLAKILVDEAPERVQELERLGVVGEWRRGRCNVWENRRLGALPWRRPWRMRSRNKAYPFCPG